MSVLDKEKKYAGRGIREYMVTHIEQSLLGKTNIFVSSVFHGR